MVARSAVEFQRAIDAYDFGGVRLQAAAVRRAGRVVQTGGVLIVGEPHGVHETPTVVDALASTLGLRTIAFEWSFDEIDDVVQRFAGDGHLDLDRLWSLPASSEFFCGDGRIAAGHFALLRRMRQQNRLDQVILLDRLDPDPLPSDSELREHEMADRLLRERRAEVPVLALVGASHAKLDDADGETMAMHLRTAVATTSAMIHYREGHGCFRGRTFPLGTPMPTGTTVTLKVTAGTPATVPGKD